MPLNDWTRAELEAYAPDRPEPVDLSEFWASTLAESRDATWPASYRPVETGLTVVETYDVTFAGFGGEPVKGWLHVPAGTQRRLPCVVVYHGYGGGRGLSHTVQPWTLAGYACLQMDTRGQGADWSPGETADPHGSGPAHPGFLTRGILDPENYYYRRVFADAVLAVDAARQSPLVDPDRIVVAGTSQGGGLALATAALVPDLAGAMANVPFLCDFPRAVRIATRDPYLEIANYLKVHRDQVDRVFRTLSYFDAAVLGPRACAPALVSVALMDETCPPSTVYAAYHAYAGPKQLTVYEFNDHEGGETFQEAAGLAWLAELFSR